MEKGGDIAEVITAIGTPGFDLAVFAFLSENISIDHCTGFIFPDGGAPIPLARHSATESGRFVMNVLAAEYAQEKYQLDEHIPAATEFANGPILKVIDSTKRTYLDFRGEWQDYPGTRQELAVFGRVENAIAYLGIYRGFRKSDFLREEIALFQSLSRPILACLLKHVAITGEGTRQAALPVAPLERHSLERHLVAILMKAPGGITLREAEVCANIILGYRAFAISEKLGICEATVASHRKHAYSKLGICSQTELFGRYIGVLHQQFMARN